MTSSGDGQFGTIRDPLVGATVDDRFLILGAVGQGATSSVYKALDEQDNKNVALKVLHTHLAQSAALVERFQREARTGAILSHPNIVSVRGFAVSHKGSPYIVEEFVEGLSLQQLLAQEKWLPLEIAIPIFAQISAALIVAHHKDVIHRDLKPGNIMLTPQDGGKYMVKILDFGCAQLMPELGETVMKVTQTGEMLGSLLYMSPEQCLDQNVDARSDCYSLGCVLYETLTGRPPLAARTAFETMNKHMTAMPDKLAHARPDLDFPKATEKLLFKAMAKSPAKRYQKINDFLDDLLKLNAAGEKEKASAKKLPAPVQAPAPVKKPVVRASNNKAKIAPAKKSEPYMDKTIHESVKSAYLKTKADIVVTMILWTFISWPVAHSWPLFLLGASVCLVLWNLMQWDIKSRTIKWSRESQVRKGIPQMTHVNYITKTGHGEHEYDQETQAVGVLSLGTKPSERREILIYGSQKGTGNFLSIEIASITDPTPDSRTTRVERLNAGSTREVRVVPFYYTGAYWQAFGDRVPYGMGGSRFPLQALLVKREIESPAIIIVESHLVVVLDANFS